jgi:hypothetical protein
MGGRPGKPMDLAMPFAEALERFIRVDPKEIPDSAQSLKRGSRGSRGASKLAKKPKKPSPSKTPKTARRRRGRKRKST